MASIVADIPPPQFLPASIANYRSLRKFAVSAARGMLFFVHIRAIVLDIRAVVYLISFLRAKIGLLYSELFVVLASNFRRS